MLFKVTLSSFSVNLFFDICFNDKLLTKLQNENMPNQEVNILSLDSKLIVSMSMCGDFKNASKNKNTTANALMFFVAPFLILKTKQKGCQKYISDY